ncbi:hypothetical protein CHISP_2065 [Chitinispirillum alkaliphilum]|nr:hypothetical protein CHISP_2065 [Chitinispirillum alkaliphilum]
MHNFLLPEDLKNKLFFPYYLQNLCLNGNKMCTCFATSLLYPHPLKKLEEYEDEPF